MWLMMVLTITICIALDDDDWPVRLAPKSEAQIYYDQVPDDSEFLLEVAQVTLGFSI